MEKASRILVVDDDRPILELLTKYLEGQGLSVAQAPTLKAMRERLAHGDVDLVVLDVLLPDGNGMEACMQMRKDGLRVPVILLTAMQEEVDRVVGLEMGADDYMGKPFSARELVARIKAVLRRSEPQEATRPETKSWTFHGFTADTGAMTVASAEGEIVPLTSAEFAVLREFLERPGRVLSRDHILEATHGPGADAFDRSVDVLMSRIRRKFKEAGAPDLFRTVRNGGYQLVAPVAARAA